MTEEDEIIYGIIFSVITIVVIRIIWDIIIPI